MTKYGPLRITKYEPMNTIYGPMRITKYGE